MRVTSLLIFFLFLVSQRRCPCCGDNAVVGFGVGFEWGLEIDKWISINQHTSRHLSYWLLDLIIWLWTVAMGVFGLDHECITTISLATSTFPPFHRELFSYFVIALKVNVRVVELHRGV